MKILPARGALAALALFAGVPAILLAAASLPWNAERPPLAPRVIATSAGSGPLQAGAAAVDLDLPGEVPIAGFSRLSYRSEGVRDPVGARALVLSAPGCKLALVSVEILLVPEELEEAVARATADLGLSGLVVAATHTHSGPGGYWRHQLGERIATGSYDPRAFEAVAGALARAIRDADAALAPATIAVARGRADDLARSRSGGVEDARLTVVHVRRPGGEPVAALAVFGAHPTILGKGNRRISGDWPGRFLADRRRGVRLFFEGALGDQSVEGAASASPEGYAEAFSARVEALLASAQEAAPSLAYAAVEVALPSPEPAAPPAVLRRAARTLAHDSFPASARVEAVRLGELVLVATPAEPVASVAAGWLAALPPGAELVSLAGGYVGYVEAPERMASGEGESARTYYGPDLARRLGDAVRLAAEAVAPSASARAP